MCGLWSGMIIGLTTEYYTSYSYKPVREVSNMCQSGAATNIIYGLALGYMSCIIPFICLAITIFGAFTCAGMFGIGLSALGMLSVLSVCLTIDGYGPIADNAGGIAEMANMSPETREKTDALDAAGNTTAAIGKGFAIGSACLVALALFGGFVTRAKAANVLTQISLLNPLEFSGIIIGAMLPYAFSALTMKVGTAAHVMVNNIREQFKNNPEIKKEESDQFPDYDQCIRIATTASLREMIAPGCLVIFTPIIFGIFFTARGVVGLLTGAIVSGVQMATSAANTGGAWDNAKKYVEAGMLIDENGAPVKKRTKTHDASIVGDTVGDPLKDTSGPSLNILVKLMSIISLVFVGLLSKPWIISLQRGLGYDIQGLTTK